jgi:hypothetical protein
MTPAYRHNDRSQLLKLGKAAARLQALAVLDLAQRPLKL